MDPAIYGTYYRMERELWWFFARQEIVFSFLEKLRPDLQQCKVLDIGTGTGSYLEEFHRRGIDAEGHDASEEAIAYLAKNPNNKIQKKNFPEDYLSETVRYDVVLMLDVLEHVQEDARGLETALRLLKPGGVLVCTVPACKAMWGPYDIVSHHFRRYSRSELKQLAEKFSGFKMVKLSYFNTLLFPLMYLVRVFENLKYQITKKLTYEPHLVSGWLNQLLYKIFRLEKPILHAVNLPYGSSLLMVLKKDGSKS